MAPKIHIINIALYVKSKVDPVITLDWIPIIVSIKNIKVIILITTQYILNIFNILKIF